MKSSRHIIAIAAFLLAAIVSATPAYATTNPPVITPGTGVYSTNPSVTMTQNQGATIDYSLQPCGGGGCLYTVPITPATDPAYIKATACLSGVESLPTTAYIQTDLNTSSVTRTGLALWLKADWAALPSYPSGNTALPGSGSSITSWLDMSASGSENDATQSTPADEPTFFTFNGPASWPSLGFNGSSQYMTLTSGLSNLTSGFTLFAVIEPQSTGTSTLFVSGNSGPTDMVSLQTSGSQIVYTAYNGTTSSSVTSSSGAIAENQYQIVEVVDTGTSATLYVNGVSVGSGTVQSLKNVTRSLNNIGANLTAATFWPGQMSELMAFTQGLSSTNRVAVESYLEQKYLISAATAPPAPSISVATSTLTAPAQIAITAGPLATVRYTQDGTTPTLSSPLYTGPVTVSYSQTLKAISVFNALSSTVASATYTLNSTQWLAPGTSDTTPLQINLQLPTGAVPP